MLGKKIKIDVDYLRPNSTFIYPLISEDGDIVLPPRVALTAEKINAIKARYGNILYYNDNGQMAVIPSFRMQIARNKSKEIMHEIAQSHKISKVAIHEAEKVIIDIVNDLTSTEILALNLLKDLKSYEEYIYNHSVNVGILSAVMARMIGTFNKDEIKNIALGGYLHDIGQMQLDKNLLEKEGKYNITDIQKMKRHPQLGYETLKKIKDVHPIVLQSVLFHHERYNNNGYYGLPYENLPIYPKIIGLCDIYDALTSKRPFRSAIEPSNALKAILNAINQQFDYQLINIFINKLGPILNNTQAFYTHNDICELNTQELAIIKDFGINDMLKPKVIIFCKFQRTGEQLLARFYEKPLEIDLSQDPNNRYMIKIINNYKQLQSIQKKLEEKKLL